MSSEEIKMNKTPAKTPGKTPAITPNKDTGANNKKDKTIEVNMKDAVLKRR